LPIIFAVYVIVTSCNSINSLFTLRYDVQERGSIVANQVEH
jgi:hypothetical protein